MSGLRIGLSMRTTKIGVLVSARITLIFFLVAGTLLCRCFSMRIMLITSVLAGAK